MDIPDDTIIYMCDKMKISELERFISTNKNYYDLCNRILEDKINSLEFQRQLQLYNTKLIVLNHINNIIDDLRNGEVLDLSTFNIRTGRGIKVTTTPGINSRLKRLDKLLYTYPGNYQQLYDILYAENPYEIF